ncbi:hypothetical protein DIJ69_33385 [Streptomyces globisporus]|nr:hypothetical protein DIJ69_33385 [Streptomyces globisporus]
MFPGADRDDAPAGRARAPVRTDSGASHPAPPRRALICFAFRLFARFRRSRAGPRHVLLHV